MAFADDHAVANAGLALAGVLSEKLGIEQLCDELIDIAPFPGRRVATLMHALAARSTSQVTNLTELVAQHVRTAVEGSEIGQAPPEPGNSSPKRLITSPPRWIEA